MTDIVTRLRERSKSWADDSLDAQIDREAADEIDRLRKAVVLCPECIKKEQYSD